MPDAHPGTRQTNGRLSAPIAVVGAGMAGLTCAVGGRARTDRVQGFLLDRGFPVLLTAYPKAERQLDLDALGLGRFLPRALVQQGILEESCS